MKTASGFIHTLISSLNADQRSFFSRFILLKSASEEISHTVLLELFHAIAGQKEYNEAILREKFKNKITSANSFKTSKLHLKDLVLESLRASSSISNYDMKVRRQLDYVDILEAQGLDKEAMAALLHLKADVKKNYSSGRRFLYEIINREGGLAQKALGPDVEDLARVARELYELIEGLKEPSRWHYYSNFLEVLISCRLLQRTTAERTEFKNICTEINRDLHQKLPGKVNGYKLHIKSRIALLNADFAAHHSFTWELWQQWLSVIADTPVSKSRKQYAPLFLITASGCLLAQKTKELSEVIATAEPVFKKYFYKDAYFYPVFLNYKLGLALLEKNADEIKSIAHKISTHPCWKSAEQNILICRNIGALMAVAHHFTGDFTGARKWAEKAALLTDPKNKAENHYYEFCNLFRFIADFDNEIPGSREQFNTSVKSYYNSIRKLDGDYRFPLAFLKFFMKASFIQDKQKLTKLFQKLKEEITPLRKQSDVKHFNALFDFHGWVEGKLVESR